MYTKDFPFNRAGEGPQLRLGFSLICSQILPKVSLGFHHDTKAQKMFYFLINRPLKLNCCRERAVDLKLYYANP